MFKYITIFIFFQPEPSGAASSNGSSPGMFYVSDEICLVIVRESRSLHCIT